MASAEVEVREARAEEREMLRHLLSHPGDLKTLSVLADWYDEHADAPNQGPLLLACRWCAAHRKWPHFLAHTAQRRPWLLGTDAPSRNSQTVPADARLPDGVPSQSVVMQLSVQLIVLLDVAVLAA
jgi:hypothetical protein